MALLDGALVIDWLRMHKAEPELLAWATQELASLAEGQSGSALPLAWAETRMLLAGMLHAASGPPVERRAVRACANAARVLMLDDDLLDDLCREEIGASFGVLGALGTLGLSVGATSDEIRRAHRRLAKLYHPDRVAHLADEFVVIAEKRTAELHEARDVLLAGDDDVELEMVGDDDDVELEPIAYEQIPTLFPDD